MAAAKAGAEGPEYDAAQAKVDAAQSALDQAKQQQAAAEAGLSQANSDVASKRDALTGAESELEAKKQTVAAAENDVTAAQAKADAAQSELTSAKQVHAAELEKAKAAQKQVDQAKAEKEQADKALETAKTNQAAADQAVVDAQKAYDTCKAAADKATTAEAQSVIGFYQFIGANDAADIIYKQSDLNPTTIGDKKDGTSLDNAKLSFGKLREINEYRKSVGLSELKVTAEQMAIAQSNSNYSDAMLDHSDYARFENAAWNYDLKRNVAHQWVDEEKNIFDQAAAKAGLGEIAPKDAWDTFWSHGTEFGEQKVGFGTVGHYLNIVQPDAKTMGYGINSRGTHLSYTYILEVDDNYGSYEKEYSIDELESLFDQYQLSLSKARHYDPIRGH